MTEHVNALGEESRQVMDPSVAEVANIPEEVVAEVVERPEVPQLLHNVQVGVYTASPRVLRYNTNDPRSLEGITSVLEWMSAASQGFIATETVRCHEDESGQLRMASSSLDPAAQVYTVFLHRVDEHDQQRVNITDEGDRMVGHLNGLLKALKSPMVIR